MPKLYDLPRDKGIKIMLGENFKATDGSKYVTFYHIDGMYSYCTTEKTGAVVHLSAVLPLKKIKKNVYEIAVPTPKESKPGGVSETV